MGLTVCKSLWGVGLQSNDKCPHKIYTESEIQGRGEGEVKTEAEKSQRTPGAPASWKSSGKILH